MRFPVFATGTSPADSKGRLDVTAIRVPVLVGGVVVRDGDLVVADIDGCVAVPQAIEAEVIVHALAKVAGRTRSGTRSPPERASGRCSRNTGSSDRAVIPLDLHTHAPLAGSCRTTTRVFVRARA